MKFKELMNESNVISKNVFIRKFGNLDFISDTLDDFHNDSSNNFKWKKGNKISINKKMEDIIYSNLYDDFINSDKTFQEWNSDFENEITEQNYWWDIFDDILNK